MPHRWIAVVTGCLLSAACAGPPAIDRPEAEPSPDTGDTERTIPVYRGPPGVGAPNPFGIKWNWAQLEALGGPLARTAGGATFFELVWCEVEPTRGRRRWAVPDAVVEGARRLGYELFLKLRVGACWTTGHSPQDRSRGKVASAMPEDLDAYRGFVTAAVERYAAAGVAAFAVENEVNARNHWVGTPADYRRLATVAAAAIRAAAPTARVLDSGISSIGHGVALAAARLEQGRGSDAVAIYRRYYERRWADRGFVYPRVSSTGELRAVLDEDRARRATEYLDATVGLVRSGVFDAVQLHFYEPWPLLPTVIDHLRLRLGRGTPIEAWEVGVAWPDDSFDTGRHAAETVKLLVTLLTSGVRRAIYLPAAYTPGGLRAKEVWRGLFLPSGRARPAAAAYAALVAAASGPDVRWRAVRHAGLAGVGFDRQEAAVVLVWSEGGSTLAGPAPAGVVATSVGGARRTWDSGGLRVGTDPVLISWPAGLDAALADLVRLA